MSSGKLPEGWVEIQLENVVDILDSMRVPINNSERQVRISGKTENELYPYFGATGEVGKIDDYIFDEELVALGEDGVPFFDGHKSKAYMLYGKTWVNNHAHVIRAIPGLSHNQYLCYYLNQFDYHDYVNGGTRLKLTQANMRRLPVSLASFAEQKVIAEKLDKLLVQVDSTKARLELIPQILKRFRQAVLAAAVSGKLTEEWRGTTTLNDWEEGILKNFIKKPSYGTSAKSQKEGLIPVLRMGNLQSGKLDWSDLVYTSDENEIEKYKLIAGDILFNRTNSPELVGKTSIFRGERKAIYAGYLIKVQCLDGLNPEYLNYHLNSHIAKQYCYEVKSDGVSQSNINAQKLAAYPLEVPPIEEQTEIVRRVELFFAYADTIEKQLHNALERVNSLTQSILAKAFRGELTAQWRAENPDLISGENSAAALLEKIKAERAASGSKKASRKKT
ncbi:Type I restriction enzyme EcoKI specificity protein [Serratia proteamaculans]|uniref:restriction endonuclease subunit S n=1 Tax=Serratia proteamaculans TaxID=28151 RepID=UPI00217BD68B|nr:restriction endonuclease subunit S [Serratia proteamaculans]CAI1109195.1 Type I restriction enzyme EcoKI specificity protein [Serratia proteamaculans]CAI1910633.1 Type I restriction enzyme EcoKI specificity protein [Serratia proteamaculans]